MDRRLTIEVVVSSLVELSQGLEWLILVPRVKTLAVVQTCHLGPLGLGLGRLNEGADVVDLAGSPHELDEIGQNIEVVRLGVQKSLVDLDCLGSLILHKHEVGQHVSGLLIGRLKLYYLLTHCITCIIVALRLVDPSNCNHRLFVVRV